MFSQQFDNKEVKKQTRVLNAKFNGLGNSIKELGLLAGDEKTILDILGTEYTRQRVELHGRAAAGLIVAPVAEPVKEVSSDPGDTGVSKTPDELATMLGTPAATNGTSHAAPKGTNKGATKKK